MSSTATSTDQHLCVICHTTYRYKCSKCPAMYCSLSCFKEHKITCPGHRVMTTDKPITGSSTSSKIPSMNDFSSTIPHTDPHYYIKMKYDNNPYIIQMRTYLATYPSKIILNTNSTTPSDPSATTIPTAQQRILNQRQQQQKIKVNDNGQNDFINIDDIYTLLDNPGLITMLRDYNLQHVINIINNAPYYNWKILLLRHQLEFNYDFSQFIEGLLLILKNGQTNSHEKNINNQKDDIDIMAKLFITKD